ncbi:MAG: hypothetical protein DCC67_07695 [Planctomycetota bacterium]|nr:MAG: hypothetical protein DCC67_07695 [Planctomycetota bacterium]
MRGPNLAVLALAFTLAYAAHQQALAVTAAPLYDWDFSPSHVEITRPRTIHAFVTVTNLPNSPVNLTGSQWYALDMYPGGAADLGGPFSIARLYSDGFSRMNLAPGESARVLVATFVPRAPLPRFYSDLLIAGGHMRVLGPRGEFLDVGGMNKQLRVTFIPEPVAVPLFATGALLAAGIGRRYR